MASIVSLYPIATARCSVPSEPDGSLVHVLALLLLVNIFIDQHVASWLIPLGRLPDHVIHLDSGFRTPWLYHPSHELILNDYILSLSHLCLIATY
jgi:hypothetical protein